LGRALSKHISALGDGSVLVSWPRFAALVVMEQQRLAGSFMLVCTGRNGLIEIDWRKVVGEQLPVLVVARAHALADEFG